MSKKDDILNTAIELFCKYGFYQTGIDRILLESKASKMTLYKYFKTKNDLILASIDKYYEEKILKILHEVKSQNANPEEKILILFEKLFESTNFGEFKCMFISIFFEFRDTAEEIFTNAQEYKLEVQKYIQELLELKNIKDAIKYSKLIMCLIEGFFAMFRITKSLEYYDIVKENIINTIKDVQN